MSYLTEERRMIRDTARRFAMEVVLPLANKLDPEKGSIPREVIDQMAEMGWFGLFLPEEFGGMGLGAFEYCLIAEELSRAWMSVGSVLARGNVLKPENLTDEQRKRWLPRMARGEFLGAVGLSEPGTGSDLANLSCRARRVSDDEYEISGSKYWVTFADGADFIIVFARTSDADPAARHKGISAFVVEKPRGELPEGCQGSPIPKIGYHGWKTWEIAFDGCRVPAANMIGGEGKGFYMASQGLEVARAHTAARSIGLARGALEDAIAWAKQRVQFGQPISEFQFTRFRVADMAAKIEACRQLMYHVCTLIDSGKRCDMEAGMVKYLAAEMSERVTSDALQIHGGAGYTTHCAVERYWRDARLTKIFEGTSEIQLRIVSNHLFKD
ncbi:acyl-CoA dehydrogenase family protein [Burkholderia sp. D-99]|uniref:acyl-CoA dehydrogenase family protein n=1 Tax=Burkholderia sp. D-99 TaxID=2717316 RepID=UPI00141E167F|nr:acyl-CoA dehydrogenase family protein [Burkholderia sp. D-99]NHV25900.1 acyl-CoA dehydrogenase [Burkholderia sp. D-99]